MLWRDVNRYACLVYGPQLDDTQFYGRDTRKGGLGVGRKREEKIIEKKKKAILNKKQ